MLYIRGERYLVSIRNPVRFPSNGTDFFTCSGNYSRHPWWLLDYVWTVPCSWLWVVRDSCAIPATSSGPQFPYPKLYSLCSPYWKRSLSSTAITWRVHLTSFSLRSTIPSCCCVIRSLLGKLLNWLIITDRLALVWLLKTVKP